MQVSCVIGDDGGQASHYPNHHAERSLIQIQNTKIQISKYRNTKSNAVQVSCVIGGDGGLASHYPNHHAERSLIRPDRSLIAG